jgi:hypothetical protein
MSLPRHCFALLLLYSSFGFVLGSSSPFGWGWGGGGMADLQRQQADARLLAPFNSNLSATFTNGITLAGTPQNALAFMTNVAIAVRSV